MPHDKPKQTGAGRPPRVWDKGLPILIVILVAMAVTHGIMFPVMHHGHSAHIDLIRQIEVNEAYRDGYVYPRWIADFYFGRGSPIFNYYAPLVYLIGQLFCMSGLTPLYAVKLVYILLVVLAGIAMFLLAREVWSERIAIACGALYVLTPYLLVDLYVRSALAELAGFAFLPLAMYFLARAARTNAVLDLASAACATALLCLAHNITALIGFPILVAWAFLVRDRAPIRRIVTVLLLGLAISSFFWLPALAERSFLNAEANLTAGDYSFAKYFVGWRDLVRPSWGFGSPMHPEGDGMSTQLGLVHLVLLLPAVYWIVTRKVWDARRRAAVAFLGIAAVSIFLTNSASRFFWDRVPLMPFVQFPFRFLLPAAVALTALAGATAWMIGERFGGRSRAYASYFLILIAAITYGPYAQARYLFHDREDPNRVFSVTRGKALEMMRNPAFIEAQDLLTPWVLREVRESKSTAMDEYLPKWVAEKPTKYFEERAEVVAGEATVQPLILRQFGYSFHIAATTPATILVHTFYFPGWTARIGETNLLIGPDKTTGEIVFHIPPGVYEVTLEFEDTSIRLFAKMLSLLALTGLIVWIGADNYYRMTGAPRVPWRHKLRERVSSHIRRSRDRRHLRRHPHHPRP